MAHSRSTILLGVAWSSVLTLFIAGCDRGGDRGSDSSVAPCPDGARALFNGVNLDGWGGDLAGYAARDGILSCLPSCSGDLVTAEQYGDFRLSFQFRLQPGSNNGIGIRAPFSANAAYDGMEIQVLDDVLPRPGLRPYQRHGSIYGVIPARDKCLAAPGQWNHEVIEARGDRIVVIVNGVTIVDANIRLASANGTIDGHGHPGLLRPAGHIHLCGHGDPVQFRNMCIQALR